MTKYIQYYNESGEFPGMILACNNFEAKNLPAGVSQKVIADDSGLMEKQIDLSTLQLKAFAISTPAIEEAKGK